MPEYADRDHESYETEYETLQALSLALVDEPPFKTYHIAIPSGCQSRQTFIDYVETQIFGKTLGRSWTLSPQAEAILQNPQEHSGQKVEVKVPLREIIQARFPQEIQQKLFSQKPAESLQAQDLDTLLRIAEILQKLPEATWQQYLSRIQTPNSSWQAFEYSLREYLEALEQRQKLKQEQADLEQQLRGKENL
ncbi:MAG: hypothetical protein NW226_03500, partial [Microscillaceae bacterium]|nr:hypothetical protein [Microscillaceae bacterium]